MKNILMIFVGLLVGVCSTVLASSLFANNLTYNPSDKSWKVTNVQAALDDLYKNGAKVGLNSAELIVNKSEVTTQISFNPTDVYKYYVLTNVYFSPTIDYVSWLEKIDIDNIANASYINIGATGRNGGGSSGASRSFLIIPNGSNSTITVSLKDKADSVSIYGIK